MPRRASGLTLVGCALLLAACGGEGENTATADPAAMQAEPGTATRPTAATVLANACEVLSGADVSGVLGQTVTDSLALTMSDGGAPVTLSQCNYATAENPALVSMLLRRGSEEQSAEEASTGVRQTLEESGIPLEEVDLGDVAFWGSNQLHVFDDAGWYLIVTPDPAAGLEQARALAQRAVERLEAGAA